MTGGVPIRARTLSGTVVLFIAPNAPGPGDFLISLWMVAKAEGCSCGLIRIPDRNADLGAFERRILRSLRLSGAKVLFIPPKAPDPR